MADASRLRPALLPMLAAMSLIPLGDAAGKMLMQDYGATPMFVGMSRFQLGAVMALLVACAMGRPPSRAALMHKGLWLRGVLIGAAVATIVSALRTEPMANVFGAFFVAPILSFFLSALVLGERATPARIILLAIGFCGVLLVVRPGFGMTPGLALAAIAGVIYGGYLTASRWLRDAAPPLDMLLVQLIVAALVLTPFGISQIPALDVEGWGWMFLSATASMLANLFLILAYGRAGATALAPFVYFQLVAATVFGLAFFGTYPDAVTLCGLVLLLASGFATLLIKR
ncbi:MAG: DMT family transporter [Oceanicola sp.]|nr:DMT family transporter [Oceanicola sp.]